MARSGDMDIKFSKSLADEVLRAPKVVEQTSSIAEKGLQNAKSSAPVDTSEYRDGLHVERKEAKFRTVFRVVGSDPKTMLIESKRGVLARALKALSKRG
jgi:hypothetical protein